jgi:phage tail P2-like protein
MANLIASSIENIPHLAAFDGVAKERLEGLNLAVLLVYVVDSAPASALLPLAEQFDVLGWKGWNLAQTEADKRALIRKAIELHRYKGTGWAIREAIKAVGFDGARIVEGVGIDYDGEHNHDADITYGGGGNWATFRVTILLPEAIEVLVDSLDKIRKLIFEYKNARSHLVDITFEVSTVDEVAMADEVDLTIYDLSDNILENGIF